MNKLERVQGRGQSHSPKKGLELGPCMVGTPPHEQRDRQTHTAENITVAVIGLTFVLFSDKPVGRVVLGSFMFVRGKELEHWNEMAAYQRETINMWHTLT